jgi:hypothetical protein
MRIYVSGEDGNKVKLKKQLQNKHVHNLCSLLYIIQYNRAWITVLCVWEYLGKFVQIVQAIKTKWKSTHKS